MESQPSIEQRMSVLADGSWYSDGGPVFGAITRGEGRGPDSDVEREGESEEATLGRRLAAAPLERRLTPQQIPFLEAEAAWLASGNGSLMPGVYAPPRRAFRFASLRVSPLEGTRAGDGEELAAAAVGEPGAPVSA
jgi:hypothetical protein